jgi:hypothetical protein
MVNRLRFLSQRSQSDWDIPLELQSPVFWENARNDLKGIEHSPNQSMKLYALVRCAKSIYSEFNDVVLKRIQAEYPGKEVTLGADDFLPIFMFVLCQSDLRTPLLNKELLWGLCHPDQLYGESGYYLTVYESALEYCQCVPITDEQLDSVASSDAGSFKMGRNQLDDKNTGSMFGQFSDKFRRSVAWSRGEGFKAGGGAPEQETRSVSIINNKEDDDNVMADLEFIRSQPKLDDPESAEGEQQEESKCDEHEGVGDGRESSPEEALESPQM